MIYARLQKDKIISYRENAQNAGKVFDAVILIDYFHSNGKYSQINDDSCPLLADRFIGKRKSD